MTSPPNLRAYDDLPDGVLVADGGGVVVLLNPSGERLLGPLAAAAAGRHYAEVLPLVDLDGRDWWSCSRPYDGLATRTGAPERLLVRTGRTAAECVELLVTARYVRAAPLGPVTRLVVCFRPNAARQRLERSRADLVSTVAHELRSPLTSVKGFTATLLAKWDRFSDEQRRHMLRTVNADADRVTRLITELLDVSRIDAGRLEVRRQVVDVAGAVRRSFAAWVAAGEPADRFRLVEDGDVGEIWADADKLEQVLGNLVENAVRHGGGTVTVTVGPDGTGVEVIVADEGEGMSPEDADRAFRKFWCSGPRGGTGLGLYIVRGLVEAHSGTIEVGNAPGGGARFRFVLPAGTPAFAQ